jgi:hypothetical protein
VSRRGHGGGAALGHMNADMAGVSAFIPAGPARPAQAGGASLAYPPPSLERGVAAACLAGGAGEAAWRDKLALLLYLLVDADIADLEAFRCWPGMCGVCKGLRAPARALPAGGRQHWRTWRHSGEGLDG